jgi:L-malate glycosyltransferase
MQQHLLHIFPSFGVGGMPLRTVRIMNHLGALCRHTVVALDGVTAAADQIQEGVPVEILPMLVNKHRPIRNLVMFRRLLLNIKPDLLATYNWGAVEWAAVNRIRQVCRHIHFEAGFGHEEASRQFRRRVIARRVALANAEAVVVPSRTLERIALHTWRLPAGQVRCIPDGIDITRFAGKKNSASGAPRPQREHIVLGTVAPLRPEKNIARLVEVFSLLSNDPRFELVIAGDGPDRMRLENLVASMGLSRRISFLGHVRQPEHILPSFDIFGVSSDTEQMPNAVLEAMAAALPIVSVDVGDIRTMIAPSNRPYVIARAEIEAFALAVRELADNVSLRHRIGTDNRIQVESRFEQERMFREYEKLLLPD